MITPANFAVFVTTASTLIGQTYSSTPVQYQAYASVMPCTSEQFTMAWTGRMPKARAWFGARHVHQPAPQTYTVVPIPYENTYGIDRFKLDDDQFGVYYRMLPDMALQWKKQPDYELRDLLENTGVHVGTRQNGLDGLTHWNTAHPIDLYDSSKGTYTNDSVGGFSDGGVTVGGALSPTAFASVIEYQTTLKDEQGERLGITPSVLMIPPNLRVEAEMICKAAFFAPPSWGAYGSITSQVGAADNVLSRMGVEPLVNHQLNSKTKWYSLDTTKAFKPFLWVVREDVTMVPRTNENDPVVFDTHTFIWGGWDRMCPAWSYAWLSHRSGT
jgi:phage major head subunit gpT-like protein